MSNSTTLLDTIAVNQANKESVVNALLDAASPATLWGRHASACSGLTWGYYGGNYVVGTTINAIANGTVTLTASTTNYVYADNATGAVSVNTTGVPTGKIPLYSIVTGTTTVTSYTDDRSYQPSAIASTASGTVTSVALTAPAQFSVGGSPVTSSGTLALTWANQTANYVLAGPTSGGAAAPTFRALVGADIPVFVGSGSSHAPGGVPDPGATAGTTKFLREDGTWAVPSTGGGGSITNGANFGSGAGQIYDATDTTSTTIAFKTIKAGTGVTVTNNAQDVTIAASGGSSITQGAFSSRPAAGTAGNVYMATDDLVESFDTGSAWVDFERGTKISRPVVGNFTLVNAGGATLTQTAYGMVFAENNVGSTTDQCRLAEISPPASGSWTLTMRFEMSFYFAANFPRFGLFARDSATGNIANFWWAPWGIYYAYEQYSSTTAWNSRTAYGGGSGGYTPLHKWMRLQYTGTNFVFSISNDGQHWVTITTISSTAWLTHAPTGCGIVVNPDNMNYAMNVIGWTATTP